MWYHGTDKESVSSILENGFTQSYGRWGEGVYLSSSKKEAETFGSELLAVRVANSKIYHMAYEDIQNHYNNVSIEEEEGVPEFKEKVQSLGYKGLLVSYNDNIHELVIYDNELITFIDKA